MSLHYLIVSLDDTKPSYLAFSVLEHVTRYAKLLFYDMTSQTEI